MYIYLFLAALLIWRPALANVSVTSSSATLIRSSSSIQFNVTDDGTGPFSWAATLAFSDYSGTTGGPCAPSDSAVCSSVDCVQDGVTPTFVCSCDYTFASLAAGDACLVSLSSVSDGTTSFTQPTRIGTIINSTVSLATGSYPTIVLSTLQSNSVMLTISGSGLPSSQAEIVDQNTTLVLSQTSYGGEATCTEGPIAGVTLQVSDPGSSLTASFSGSALQDGCKITALLTRFDRSASSSNVGVAISSAPSVNQTSSRGYAISSSYNWIDIVGENLPKFDSELSSSTLALAWAGGCSGNAAPVCSNLVIASNNLLQCNTTLPNTAVDRCQLTATVSRFGASSSAQVIGVAVDPLNFVATSNDIAVGVAQSLFLNFSRSVSLTPAEQAASTVSLVATGAGCSWASGPITPTFNSEDQAGIAFTVSSGQPAACSVSASFALFGIAGSPIVIGTTSTPSAPMLGPLEAPFVGQAPATAPASSPVVAASPIAAPSNITYIYIVISGRTLPTDLLVDEIVAAIASVLNLNIGDLSGHALGIAKRAVFNYTIEIGFLSQQASAERDLLIANSTLQSAVVASVFDATSGLYSGVSYSTELIHAPVESPHGNELPVESVLESNHIDGGFPGGAIAAGIIAGLVILVIIVFLIFIVVKAKRGVKPAPQTQNSTEPAAAPSPSLGHRRNFSRGSNLMDSTYLIDHDHLVEMEAMQRARELQRQREREEEEREEHEAGLTSSGEEKAKEKRHRKGKRREKRQKEKQELSDEDQK